MLHSTKAKFHIQLDQRVNEVIFDFDGIYLEERM
jgi:hypothetical protein